MASRLLATALSTASTLRPIAHRVLDFCEGLLDRVKIGTVGRQEEQLAPIALTLARSALPL
jgi:hypothetical protein